MHEHCAGCQVFQFAIFRWCINHVEELIEADPDAARLVDDVPVKPFGQFLSLEAPAPGYTKLIEVLVSPEYAATTDLSKPIMIAPIILGDENIGGMAIDGWHRIYRALNEGVTELPAYILTEATSVATQFPWR
ncbi:hypothetical protein [Actinophytocola sediminis]